VAIPHEINRGVYNAMRDQSSIKSILISLNSTARNPLSHLHVVTVRRIMQANEQDQRAFVHVIDDQEGNNV